MQDEMIKKEIEKSNELIKEANDFMKKPSKEELIVMLEHMIESYERLPPHAAMIPISHQDYWAGLLLVCEILKR